MKKIIVWVFIAIYACLPILSLSVEGNGQTKKLVGSYGVIVFGGEPEGVAAAVSSARNGNHTLLIAKRDGLGGVMTYGMLNFLDISYDKEGNLANTGIFKEWHQLVGGKVGFDIADAQDAFLELVKEEENLTLITEATLKSVIMQGDRLTGIKIIDSAGKEQSIQAKRFIDSTQDADLAVKAGAPFFVGGEDIGLDRKMAVTPMIHLDNVDWEEIKQAAKEEVFGGGKVNGNVAWGFSKLHYAYEPYYAETTRLRGLNIVRQKDGTVVINALQIFGVDGLDEESREKALEKGKKETKHVLKFLQENFPGFEDAEIASHPEELYVRETRHIKAEYQFPLSDIWENKYHWDAIGFGAYPVDVQATSVNDYGYVYTNPVQYTIPFRSLVPLKVDGLLVASKASGYSSLAAASTRVIPTGMTAGQAAGIAAAISINNDISFREMTNSEKAIEKMQTRLKKQGVKLYSFDIPFPYEGEWFYPAASTLLNYGLILGGYDNKLPVEKPISELSFANILSNGVQRITSTKATQLENNLDAFRAAINKETELTRNRAAELILTLYGIKDDGTNPWAHAKEIGLIDETIVERITQNRVLTGAEGYYIAGKLMQEIEK
ncbi:FAD-dependent oxidoreductase [Virgibacillus sp. DJP39]|uniref:FAD-dependent oxidoreductase n=1 Tax=Virgibacillus sp. DJP39 TaxID=3409790 RepID=UPI003BB685CD